MNKCIITVFAALLRGTITSCRKDTSIRCYYVIIKVMIKMLDGQNGIVKRLRDDPDYLVQAATWFGEKWDIPVEAYLSSMGDCIHRGCNIPQWYFVVSQQNKLIAGAGVIENDFHLREDLTPNVCALFVEQEFRKQGLARAVLDAVRRDMGAMGIERLYLLSDHTAFYEACGWELLHTTVLSETGTMERMYVAQTIVQDDNTVL